MKQIYFTILILLVAAPVAFSQEYQAVNLGRIAYFRDSTPTSIESRIQSLRIDSSGMHQADSILRPAYTIHRLGKGCVSPIVGSWIGPEVIIQPDGMNLFFNRHLDTVRINTKADLHDQWLAMDKPDSCKVEASVIAHDTMHFLGLVDSIKTIRFQVFDANMDTVHSVPANGLELWLSKNYGMVKALNFFAFPDHQLLNLESGEEALREFPVAGLSHPQVGIQNLTAMDVHDYQVGDELHILFKNLDKPIIGGGSETTEKSIFRFLSRTDYQDSITYSYWLRQSTLIIYYRETGNTTVFHFLSDTIQVTYSADSTFDSYPGEVISTGWGIQTMRLYNGNIPEKVEPDDNQSYQWENDSCWAPILADACISEKRYFKGLGGPYYDCRHPFYNEGGMERELVYYKKGSRTWGSPLMVTGMQEKDRAGFVNVFPNPVTDYLQVSMQDLPEADYLLEIIDINGRVRKSQAILHGNNHLDLSGFLPGFYFYKLRNMNGLVKTGKLVVE